MCLWRELACTKAFSHLVHLNCLTPVCVGMWAVRLLWTLRGGGLDCCGHRGGGGRRLDLEDVHTRWIDYLNSLSVSRFIY